MLIMSWDEWECFFIKTFLKKTDVARFHMIWREKSSFLLYEKENLDSFFSRLSLCKDRKLDLLPERFWYALCKLSGDTLLDLSLKHTYVNLPIRKYTIYSSTISENNASFFITKKVSINPPSGRLLHHFDKQVFDSFDCISNNEPCLHSEHDKKDSLILLLQKNTKEFLYRFLDNPDYLPVFLSSLEEEITKKVYLAKCDERLWLLNDEDKVLFIICDIEESLKWFCSIVQTNLRFFLFKIELQTLQAGMYGQTTRTLYKCFIRTQKDIS